MKTYNVLFLCKSTGIRHWWPDVTEHMISRYQGDYEMMGWHTMLPHVMEG
jgi:hypothetical protein